MSIKLSKKSKAVVRNNSQNQLTASLIGINKVVSPIRKSKPHDAKKGKKKEKEAKTSKIKKPKKKPNSKLVLDENSDSNAVQGLQSLYEVDFMVNTRAFASSSSRKNSTSELP